MQEIVYNIWHNTVNDLETNGQLVLMKTIIYVIFVLLFTDPEVIIYNKRFNSN